MNAPQGNTSNLGNQITSNVSNAMERLPNQQSIQEGITSIGNTTNTTNQIGESLNDFPNNPQRFLVQLPVSRIKYDYCEICFHYPCISRYVSSSQFRRNLDEYLVWSI